jgi:hypothetical protein
MRRNLSFLLLLLAAGCATTAPPGNLPRVVNSFPADALVIQRGVLTLHGRQFALDGYVALSATGGTRLIMTESLGGVLADVLVKRDGTIHLMRPSKMFRSEWIQHYVVADLNCIFGDAPKTDCPGRMLSPTHFVIERRGYTLDLQTVETRPGPQTPELFDETRRGSP